MTQHINSEIVNKDHAEKYGKKIVATLWRQLEREYDSSFSEKKSS